MLDKKVKELINTQVNKEFYSAYLYLDFANYYYHDVDQFFDKNRITPVEIPE